MQASFITLLFPILMFIGSIVLFVMFVLAHRRLAKAHEELSVQVGKIAKALDKNIQ